MSEAINFLMDIFQGWGYTGVVALMAIESSFFPLPSEIVIPPAAFLAQQGKMNLAGVIACGTLGSIIGACFNYLLGLFLGRPIIYKLAEHRFAKIIMITPAKIKRTEDFFLKNANASTFIGRLIPVIRHLISLPAGFSRMNFGNFLFYTFLGSFIWVSILAVLGYLFGANQDLLLKYYKEISTVLVIVFILFLMRLVRKYRKNNSSH